ncbi:MAG: hypothetical protein U0414_03830 [Polyangiaceae bacterium]
MNRRNALLQAVAGFALTTGLATPLVARAVSAGETAPEAKVQDADDRALWMSELKGSPVVVFYEDKDSRDMNSALKSEVASLMGESGMSGIRVIPIADVSDYDSWPARGFVKDAVREESKKAGLTIYCDWDASFRAKYDLVKGSSNVVIVGRDGVVKAASSGSLSSERRAAVLSLLRAEAAKTP